MKDKKEQWFYYSEETDPVFEGMVKEFMDFHTTLECIHAELDGFVTSMDQLAEGLQTLSESVIADWRRFGDHHMVSESCRMREAMNQMVRMDAPRSARAKLHKNMDFNVKNPLQDHLENCEKLKLDLEKRQRRLEELRSAKVQMDECARHGLTSDDKRLILAQAEFDDCRKAFEQMDRHIFEWLYILEEHRGDILDSSLQTLKYLQYEFFAMSAHAISGSLPARMEFRPMVEMSPDCLAAQVELELARAEEALPELMHGKAVETEGRAVDAGFAARFVERLARDDDGGDTNGNSVDALSLSALVAQGFEDGLARRALRIHRNDTQAALDWLLDSGNGAASAQDHRDSPTVPLAATPARAPTAGGVGGVRLRRLLELKERQGLAVGIVSGTSSSEPTPGPLGASSRRGACVEARQARNMPGTSPSPAAIGIL